MTYRKIKSLSELEDGWYWWRTGQDDDDPSIEKVQNGATWNTYREEEERDPCGEWAGPIPTPEEWQELNDFQDKLLQKPFDLIEDLHGRITKLQAQLDALKSQEPTK